MKVRQKVMLLQEPPLFTKDAGATEALGDGETGMVSWLNNPAQGRP